MYGVELLKKLVSMNSIFPNERPLAEFMEQQLQERGFRTKRIYISENRFNVVGERGAEGKPVMLYGHLDTVPVYGKWSSDPLIMREEGGKLHGLGIYDMKAGLATILSACQVKTERRIKVAFGVDEENISEGAWAIVKDGFLKDVEAIIVPEINDSPGNIPGTVGIMLGRRGRAVYRISVPGRSSHGAHIEDGISAISEASRLVLELEKWNSSLGDHPKLPSPSQFIRKIYSESTSLSLPEEAVIELDRHLVPPETTESVLSGLRVSIGALYEKGMFKEIDGKRIRVEPAERKTPYLDPYLIPEDLEVVKKLKDSIESEKAKMVFTYGASVADENVFAAQGVPVVSLGPEGAQYHSADEWVDKKSFERLIKIYSRFISSL